MKKKWLKGFIVNVAEKEPEMLEKLLGEIRPTPEAVSFYGEVFELDNCNAGNMVHLIKNKLGVDIHTENVNNEQISQLSQ
ncbi:MAG: hypothetical protein K0S11_603 [Gammaproteobacteria bacterium]|nr:hypothetical protein [Gammaproteobacteria bacterium]